MRSCPGPVNYIASTGSFIQKPQFGFLKFGFLVNDDLDEQAGPNPQTQRLLRSSRFFIALPGDRENFGLSNAIAPEIWLQSDEVWHCAGKRITLVGDRPVGVELAQSLRSLHRSLGLCRNWNSCLNLMEPLPSNCNGN